MPENQNAQTYLEDIEIETPSPYGEVLNLVRKYGVDNKFIDFEILDFKTECKIVGEKSPRMLAQSKLGVFDDDKFYVEKVESLKQIYRVKFYDLRRAKPIVLPSIAINANKNLTKILATVSRGGDAVYFEELGKMMVDFIY